jgi:hypothetical protein
LQYQNTISKDVVCLDKYALSDFLEAHPRIKSYTFRTLQRGLNELVNCQILARHYHQGSFYINPYFMFNGDRIAFTTVIERDTSKDHGQKDLLEDEIRSKRLD